MRNALSLLTLCHLLSLAPTAALALGFGRVDSTTVLGQRLNFSTQLSVEPHDALTEACIVAEVQAGDSRVPPNQIRISLGGGPNATQRLLRITTTGVIDEPVVTINATIGCGSRVSRSFIVFADPPPVEAARGEGPLPALVAGAPERRAGAPALSEAPVALGSPALEPGPRIESNFSLPRPVVPRRDATRRTTAEPARNRTGPAAPRVAARPAERSRAASPPVAVAVPATPRATIRAPAATTAARSSAAGASAVGAGGPRLQLEADTGPALRPGAAAAASAPTAAAAAPGTATVPTAAAPGTLPATAAAPSTSAEFERLRTQNQALQRSVAGLESRLRELEAGGGRDPWFSLLAVLAAGLALVGVALLWRRVQSGNAGTWWKPSALAPVEVATVAPTLAPASVSVFGASQQGGDGVVDDDDDGGFGAQTTRGFAMTLPGQPNAPDSRSSAARGALSVEELFDLEQQADFFLALGQEDAAIDLLLGHARGPGATSPMPYLKLAEIYRRRGDREGFEATREGFNQRFNAQIGAWDEPVSEGLALDESPELLRSIQSIWIRPGDAAALIETLVWRTDEPRPPVDLAAYRDLLFLYAIARDRLDVADSDRVDQVDLPLPLLEGISGSSHVAQLMSSTIPMRVQAEHARGLDRGIVPDLDLSVPVAEPAAESSETAVSRPDFTLGSDLITLDPPPAEPKT
ncbi:MAG: hypothetical protein ABIO45_04075 [Burkholderiaceae bacterium]